MLLSTEKRLIRNTGRNRPMRGRSEKAGEERVVTGSAHIGMERGSQETEIEAYMERIWDSESLRRELPWLSWENLEALVLVSKPRDIEILGEYLGR